MVQKPKTQPPTKVVRLREFNILEHFLTPNNEWTHPLGIILGSRRSGKSTKGISLLWESKHIFGTAYRFSPTANSPRPDGSYLYGNIFPKCGCFSELKLENGRSPILEGIQKLQRYITQESTRPAGVSERDTYCLMLFDDMSSNKALMRSNQMDQFASNCRNDRITMLVLVQYLCHVTTTMRENCDFFMINFIKNEATIKKLRTEVFGDFPTDHVFKQAIKFYTKGKGSLVWVNLAGDNAEIEDTIFYYKVKHLQPDFTLENCNIQNFLDENISKTKEQIAAELEAEYLRVENEEKAANQNEYDEEEAEEIDLEVDEDEDELDEDDEEYQEKPQKNKSRKRKAPSAPAAKPRKKQSVAQAPARGRRKKQGEEMMFQ